MINSLISKLEKKNLFKNIFSLSLLQGANYILYFLTIPYLIRVLGIENFGLLAFATATCWYFILITDYGFNFSASRIISIHREDKHKINEIFSSVMTIKFGLLFLSFIVLLFLILCFEKFGQNCLVYFLTFGTVIGHVLFPQWLFQGLERMTYIAKLNIYTKLFFTLCIFIFVRNESDLMLAPLFTSLGFIVAGAWSLFLVKKDFAVTFKWQPFSKLKYYMREGSAFFFTNLTISLYTNSTIFILGLLTNNVSVGYYSVADRIIQAVKGLYVPVFQAFYPFMSKKIHETPKIGVNILLKSTSILSIIMFVISSILFFFAEPIIALVMGKVFDESVFILKMMAYLPFIIVLSNMFGIQGLYNLGYAGLVNKYIALVATIHFACIFFIISSYGSLGAAKMLLLTETVITLLSAYFFFKKARETLG